MGNEPQVPLGAFIARFLRSVRWWWVLVPVVIGLAAYLWLRFGASGMATLIRVKETMETSALLATCAAVAVAGLRCAIWRRPLGLWLLLLASLLAFREWHIVAWASTLAYIGIFSLFVAAWLNDEPVGRHLTAHPASTLLVLTCLSYALTRPLDMDVLQTLSPEEHPALAPFPFVEEIVENVGHACLLILMIVARAPKRSSDAA